MVREGLRAWPLSASERRVGLVGARPDDPWMTGYVLIGLATARAEGYAVSEPASANRASKRA